MSEGRNPVKDAMHRQYADAGVIKVEVPEWPDADGNPTTVRFRSRLTVDDLEYYLARQSSRNIYAVLFRLLAVNEDMTPLVDPNDDEWFTSQVDGGMVSRVAARAGLQREIFNTNAALLREAGEDSEPGEKPLFGSP